MTTDLTLQSVLHTIKESAFVHSPYPVVLSLEMHCTGPQQKVCATLLNDILGTEHIYHLPSDLADIDDFKDLPIYPPLNELKNKFIIKCKTKRILPKLFTDTFRSQHTQIIQNYTTYQRNEEGLKRTAGATTQATLNLK